MRIIVALIAIGFLTACAHRDVFDLINPATNPSDCMVLGKDNVWRTCRDHGRGLG